MLSAPALSHGEKSQRQGKDALAYFQDVVALKNVTFA